jgi:hypothetical protein
MYYLLTVARRLEPEEPDPINGSHRTIAAAGSSALPALSLHLPTERQREAVPNGLSYLYSSSYGSLGVNDVATSSSTSRAQVNISNFNPLPLQPFSTSRAFESANHGRYDEELQQESGVHVESNIDLQREVQALQGVWPILAQMQATQSAENAKLHTENSKLHTMYSELQDIVKTQQKFIDGHLHWHVERDNPIASSGKSFRVIESQEREKRSRRPSPHRELSVEVLSREPSPRLSSRAPLHSRSRPNSSSANNQGNTVVRGLSHTKRNGRCTLSSQMRTMALEHHAKLLSKNQRLNGKLICMDRRSRRTTCKWTLGLAGMYACFLCTKNGRPCLIYEEGSEDVLVLPLPTQFLKANCVEGSKNYYILPNAAQRSKELKESKIWKAD